MCRACKGLLGYADPDLLCDKAFILDACVSSGGLAFEHAATHLKQDRAFVLEAIYKGGWALKFASPEMLADKELILASLPTAGGVFAYIAEELRESKAFVIEALQATGDGMAFKHLSEAYRLDKDCIFTAMAGNNGLVTLQAIPAEFLEEDEEENEGAFQMQCKKVALLAEIERERLCAAAIAAAAEAATKAAAQEDGGSEAEANEAAGVTFVTEPTAISGGGGGGEDEEEDEAAAEAAKEAQRAADEVLKKEMRRTVIPQLLRKAKPQDLRDDAEVARITSGHCIIVLSGRKPATFYLC